MFWLHIYHRKSVLLKFGRYGEALGKWEAALTLVPENAVLHEQKAQVLLEIADSWNALKAATSVLSSLFLCDYYISLLLSICDGSRLGNLFLKHH